MSSEDVIRDIARSVSARVLASEPSSPPDANSRELLVIAQTGIDPQRLFQLLRARRGAGLTLPEILVSADYREQNLVQDLKKEFSALSILEIGPSTNISDLIKGREKLSLSDLPWQIATQVVSLNADGGPAELIAQALLSGTKVIACVESLRSLVAGNTQNAPGLRAALTDLESKLAGLGIELLGWAAFLAREAGEAIPVLAARPPMPIEEIEHPSSRTFNEPDEIREFVEFLEHKPCCLEPGKPCVGSARCRTLGF